MEGSVSEVIFHFVVHDDRMRRRYFSGVVLQLAFQGLLLFVCLGYFYFFVEGVGLQVRFGACWLKHGSFEVFWLRVFGAVVF